MSFEYCHGYGIQGLESKVEGPLRRRFKAKGGKTRIQEAARVKCTRNALAPKGLSVLNISMRIPIVCGAHNIAGCYASSQGKGWNIG